MAHKVFDLAQQLTTGTGTGALSLGAVPSGMLGFEDQGAGAGDTFWGCIRHTAANEVEVTLCTFVGDGTVTRATVPLASTTGAKIAFSAGTKTISCVAPASKSGVVADPYGLYSFPGPIAVETGGSQDDLGVRLDAGLGFYKPSIGTYGAGMGAAVQGMRVLEAYSRPSGTGGFTFDNAWFLFGPDTPISALEDTYVVTFSTPSVDISGATPRYIGFNIGSTHLTSTDTATKTSQQAILEMDKLHLEQATDQSMTWNDAVNTRFRWAWPGANQKILWNKGISFVIPVLSSGASIDNLSAIHFPNMAGISGVAKSYGLYFEDAPPDGNMVSAPGRAMNIFALGSGTATFRGANTVIDSRVGEGGSTQLWHQGNKVLQTGTVGASANFLTIDANNVPMLRANHASSSDVPLNLSSKGASSVQIMTGAGSRKQFEVMDRASVANSIWVRGGATGSGATLGAQGSDTDVDLVLQPQGAGVLRFGTRTAIGAETITGFITIKDSGGTTRKLAVVS